MSFIILNMRCCFVLFFLLFFRVFFFLIRLDSCSRGTESSLGGEVLLHNTVCMQTMLFFLTLRIVQLRGVQSFLFLFCFFLPLRPTQLLASRVMLTPPPDGIRKRKRSHGAFFSCVSCPHYDFRYPIHFVCAHSTLWNSSTHHHCALVLIRWLSLMWLFGAVLAELVTLTFILLCLRFFFFLLLLLT
jgi:hypothetical protein